MKKTILPMILVFTMVCSLSFPVFAYASSSLSEINSKLARVKQDQAAAKQRAEQAKAQIQQIEQKKDSLNEKINEFMKKIDAAANQLASLHTQVNQKQTELTQNAKDLLDAQSRVTHRNHMLADKLQIIYMNGAVSYLDVLMHAKSFSDFISRWQDLKQVIHYDHEVLVRNQKDSKLISQKQDQLKAEAAQIQQEYDQEQGQKSKLETLKQQNEVQVASYKKQEKNLNEVTKSETDQLNQLISKQSQLLEQKNELQYTASGKLPPLPYSSKTDLENKPKGDFLSWPFVHNYVITSHFGWRTDPINGSKSFHDGVDIGAPNGETIHAAADGVVLIARWVRGYGNCIVIDHGHKIHTLYGHMQTGSMKVRAGQHVKAGQPIGLVGMTGRATGPHLHFGVYYNSKAIDPWVLLRNR